LAGLQLRDVENVADGARPTAAMAARIAVSAPDQAGAVILVSVIRPAFADRLARTRESGGPFRTVAWTLQGAIARGARLIVARRQVASERI
jgi:hypothetical protein